MQCLLRRKMFHIFIQGIIVLVISTTLNQFDGNDIGDQIAYFWCDSVIRVFSLTRKRKDENMACSLSFIQKYDDFLSEKHDILM